MSTWKSCRKRNEWMSFFWYNWQAWVFFYFDNRFLHFLQVSIACPERMEPITKVSHIPPSRWALVCSLCKLKTGACIQVRTCAIMIAGVNLSEGQFRFCILFFLCSEMLYNGMVVCCFMAICYQISWLDRDLRISLGCCLLNKAGVSKSYYCVCTVWWTENSCHWMLFANKKILYWVIPMSEGSIFLRMCRKMFLVRMDFHVVEVIMSFFFVLLLLLLIEAFCLILCVVLCEKLHHCLSCHLCLWA